MYRLRETDIMIERDDEEGDNLWIKNDLDSDEQHFSYSLARFLRGMFLVVYPVERVLTMNVVLNSGAW